MRNDVSFQDLERELERGVLPAWVFSDGRVYEWERERIFKRVWHFLAHESEIPEAGDYVVRYIVDTPVIVVRTEQGVRAHVNMCRHRGAPVCRGERGRSRVFRCPYHGWTYSNSGELVGIPFREQIYADPGRIERELSLPLVRVQSYRGLIFGTLSERAPSLEEYLGESTWYLDLFGCRGLDLEVFGDPERWTLSANWKTAAENFGVDNLHILSTHGSLIVELEQFPFRQEYLLGPTNFVAYFPGRGHAIAVNRPFPGMKFVGVPEPLIAKMEAEAPEQAPYLDGLSTVVGTIWPNLSLLTVVQPLGPYPVGQGETPRYWTIRVWQPMGPTQMQVWSWCLVPRGMSEEQKRKSFQAYRLSFGVSGTFEQDDAEVWKGITELAASLGGREVRLNYEIDGAEGPWSGQQLNGAPGVIRPYVTEAGARNFWRTWLSYLRGGEG
ncbi:3-phenylpropionate/cinnamic acid dioxygenase subunit alpha [bacterium HR10]|nr:3-phenylpropionate/cinnamic acid dioxygenase subunit alpha [bacterium HR10]